MISMPTIHESYTLGFLGLETHTGEFKPILDNTKRNASLPLDEWWEMEPVLKLLNDKDETVTRKEIILAANEDERLPISEEIQAKYARLKAGLGIKTMVRTAAGQDLGIIFQNAHLAALRQIGHELLKK